jgi:hypothetical protein
VHEREKGEEQKRKQKKTKQKDEGDLGLLWS